MIPLPGSLPGSLPGRLPGYLSLLGSLVIAEQFFSPGPFYLSGLHLSWSATGDWFLLIYGAIMG